MSLNNLSTESSLYLQQHADNPVNWYPWGPEALKKAKQENKPILLSIGYSACHWCHVMAAESFADTETAKVMNDLFINIKVDREERPDLDKIYQITHQLLTGRGGGWPLTVFLNPDNQIPFFAGTYFPHRSGLGTPNFKEILRKVAGFYHDNKAAIADQNIRMQDALQQLVQGSANEKNILDNQVLILARKQIAGEYDPINAGFGFAPKFPQPGYLEFLMTYTKDSIANIMLQTTLDHMARGGIYDQLGGGFFRYAVDATWQIPHFEKMLYDNAQLLAIYSKLSDQPEFANIAEATAQWVLREMSHPEGGFYSTLDADSEHHEGKYYYWNREEIKGILTAEEYKIVETYFGLKEEANFEGHWHLHIPLDQDIKYSDKLLLSAKKKLLQARETRIRPGRDEKIITAWNGLIIKGLALAGYYLKKTEFINAAQKALDFIHSKLWQNNRLYSTYQNNQSKQKAYLDDYAFLLEGILVLYKITKQDKDLKLAIQLANNLLEYFEDKENGGFFFTASDHEPLIMRPKPLMDEALPSGNGIAALGLFNLSELTKDMRYKTAAQNTLKVAAKSIIDYPIAHTSLLLAFRKDTEELLWQSAFL